MSKYIIVDNASIVHSAIFSWNAQKKRQIEQNNEDSFILPSHYTYFASLISLLKRVGVNKDDTIILANDGRNSWRKAFYPLYKGQREAFRKSHELIDWNFHYKGIQKTINQIEDSTNFHIIWLSGMYNYLDLLNTEEGEKLINVEEINEPLDYEFGFEADDIASVCCSYFKDKEIILITKDLDWSMLCVYPNVKFFSMNTKWKGGTGVYKEIENGYKVLDNKIRLGDKSDNIFVPENDTEKDQQIRKLIIDLINLPEWIQKPIKEILENLPKKECDFSKLPFSNSLAKRFPQIYQNDKIITYEDSIKRLERKKIKIQNKKLKLKKQMTMRKIKKGEF